MSRAESEIRAGIQAWADAFRKGNTPMATIYLTPRERLCIRGEVNTVEEAKALAADLLKFAALGELPSHSRDNQESAPADGLTIPSPDQPDPASDQAPRA